MPELFKAPNKKTPVKHAVASPASSGGTLASFMVRPNGIRFETQEPTEEILLLMRQHPITQVGWVLATIVLFFLPGLIVPFILSLGILVDIPPGYFVVLPLTWYLGVFGFAFTNFLHWYFNIYIVTTERIVDIDWVSLLYKRLSSTQLEKIQDVSYKQGGILDSFFDFGNIYIQTAGSEPNFEFDAVPKPDHVVREINAMIEKETDGNHKS